MLAQALTRSTRTGCSPAAVQNVKNADAPPRWFPTHCASVRLVPTGPSGRRRLRPKVIPPATCVGGGDGIRTHGRRSPSAVFKSQNTLRRATHAHTDGYYPRIRSVSRYLWIAGSRLTQQVECNCSALLVSPINLERIQFIGRPSQLLGHIRSVDHWTAPALADGQRSKSSRTTAASRPSDPGRHRGLGVTHTAVCATSRQHTAPSGPLFQRH